MKDLAIQFDNVGKLYKLGLVGTGTLSHDLNRWWSTSILHKEDPYLKIGETNDREKKGNSDYVWALKNIAFDVEMGDVVGIIGKNGAGKSTLLKLLSQVTSPTTGVIKAKGRIASLLEVGTGFHPELTGKENIYMNGSIMGMTRHEITKKLDDIVSFAGVERYVDTPVKRYSSGMSVRLGFAIAAFLEPEILVVDEVLAVGDAEFQKKAIGKMKDISQGGGRTVLFVSHNMASIKSLCNKAIVLDNGQVSFNGNVIDGVNRYLGGEEIDDNKCIKDYVSWKHRYITISDIELNGTSHVHSEIRSEQRSMSFKISGLCSENILVDPMIIIRNRDEVPMAALAEGHCKGKMTQLKSGAFTIEREIGLPKILSNGDYIVDFYLHRPMMEWYVKAPHCAEIHIEGFQEGFGRALKVKEEGFIGLESY